MGDTEDVVHVVPTGGHGRGEGGVLGQHFARNLEFLKQDTRLDTLDLGPRRHLAGAEIDDRLERLTVLLDDRKRRAGDRRSRCPHKHCVLGGFAQFDVGEPRRVVHVARFAEDVDRLEQLIAAERIERMRLGRGGLNGMNRRVAAGQHRHRRCHDDQLDPARESAALHTDLQVARATNSDRHCVARLRAAINGTT